MNAGRQLLTPVDVMRRLRCGRTKAYDLIRSKRLRSMRIGTAIRVLESDLDDSIENELGGRIDNDEHGDPRISKW